MRQSAKVIARGWTRNGLRLSAVLVWAGPWAWPVPFSVGDQVILPTTLPGTGDAVVVVQGGVTGGCVYDLLRKGRGTITFGQLVPGAGCSSEVILFAQGRAMRATQPLWTTADDQVTLLSPPTRPRVEFNMVLVAPGDLAAQQAGRDTLRAISVFNRNRVGLSFRTTSVTPSSALASAQKTMIGDRCDATALANLATAGTPLYDSKRLNVYFVPGTPGGFRGRNCFTVGFPNVIYISIAGDSPGTLAHEFGHALALQDSPGHSNGHTGVMSTPKIQGFVYQNLMWTGLYDQEALAQRHFSIGQAYRMNMDKTSWVIRVGLVPGRVGRTCHPSVAEDSIPCPKLALDTTAALP
ncbi:MAG TPA: hypothetical protein VHR41_16510 [Gemmatimonadales bacterium]|jgi:hypothetical protein|nr:hypothetical protein [Gemmatimonadales bacterium]